ncbi:hypothetical protein BHYA_0284g00020 [Botrytis hyacinthi]|uniref:Uncharacterized protein n=1 Tax=Botrytis hyacinthi TaxID=278943 RepID=A0A4Z1G7I1_9HELO|nr:hypothetical protein BHYA_0284g00020 [Botrytis hyacinthi]
MKIEVLYIVFKYSGWMSLKSNLPSQKFRIIPEAKEHRQEGISTTEYDHDVIHIQTPKNLHLSNNLNSQPKTFEAPSPNSANSKRQVNEEE